MTGLLLVDLFEERAKAAPDAVALALDDATVRVGPTALAHSERQTSYTYETLNLLAEELSLYIIDGINASSIAAPVGGTDAANATSLVSVLMDRDVGIIVAMLATLKASAAYVPVDPAFPPDRQSYIFEHSQCQLLIADEECYATAAGLGVTFPPTIIVSRRTGKIVGQNYSSHRGARQSGIEKSIITSMEPPDTGLVSESRSEIREMKVQRRVQRDLRPNGGLAYVLYTSGSTGELTTQAPNANRKPCG
jgi:non-ribosomal peptide synthetase component F